MSSSEAKICFVDVGWLASFGFKFGFLFVFCLLVRFEAGFHGVQANLGFDT